MSFAVKRRIEALLDVGSGFDELRSGFGRDAVAGYGSVWGRRVALWTNDPEVFAGSLSAEGMEKVSELYEGAAREGLPVVYLADSAGAKLQEGARSLNGVAKAYRSMTMASSRVPLISAVIGGSVGGSAFMVASSDVIIGNAEGGYLFVSGPASARRFRGLTVGVRELGGVEVLWRKGAFDLVRPDEAGAVAAVRDVLGYLPQNTTEMPPVNEAGGAEVEAPGCLPDSDAGYDVRAVIRSVVDGGSFLEFGDGYSESAVVGLARVEGRPVGVVANQPSVKMGAIDVGAALKMARFVSVCDKNNLPVVTFVDTVGFEPGPDQEHGNLPRHGAKLLYSYATSEVPKVTVILRRAYAGGFVSMCSKGLGANHVIALPESEVMVQEPRLAVELVRRRELDAVLPEKREELLRTFAEEMRHQFAGGEKLLRLGAVDAVVELRELRTEIWRALDRLLRSYAERLGTIEKCPLFPV
ncbi:MAG: methylmalonyl-CoA carboxyltransferase [Thaumarchaeota archaeon]|nr:methylmalonyl-CoA carboxyltransferase [Candidatus Calditenuaceae archaeon]MDW8042093.1 carboxyl transferase domain-containing protein [Nitrososphaerota archaeon]